MLVTAGNKLATTGEFAAFIIVRPGLLFREQISYDVRKITRS